MLAQPTQNKFWLNLQNQHRSQTELRYTIKQKAYIEETLDNKP